MQRLETGDCSFPVVQTVIWQARSKAQQKLLLWLQNKQILAHYTQNGAIENRLSFKEKEEKDTGENYREVRYYLHRDNTFQFSNLGTVYIYTPFK